MMWTIPGLAVGAALAAPVEGAGGVIRHALVIGANDGGAGLEPLRYAEDDASRVVDVLTELGGFRESNVTVLEGPDREALVAALAHHASLAETHPQDLFVFYYSGHADARGLRLGQEVLPYGELKERIRNLPSEIRLGVLDACRSGEITRIKGFSVTTPFAAEELLPAEGEAWLTATAADEQAQESDALRGSFFTHYLVSGLRGAADAQGGEAGDGRVSLVEAYDYAFDRTVARTGATGAGTQHPGYDFRLQGQGDLALTDVRRATARLLLPDEMAGEVTVLRMPDGLPVAELAKAPGVPMSVALPPGRYRLQARGPEGVGEAFIGLSEGSTMRVREFRSMATATASAKGTSTAPAGMDILDVPPPQASPPEWQELPVLDRFRVGMGELGTGWRRLRDGAADAVDEFSLGSELEGLDLPEHALALTTGDLPTAGVPCPVEGPACIIQLAGTASLPDTNGDGRLLHASGSLAAVGSLQEGQPVGTWVFFHPSGERLAAGAYLQGEPSGPWTWWWKDGTRRERGTFVEGRRAGVWVEYHENGRRKRRTNYSEGEAIGLVREWYDNGRLRSSGEVLDGRPSGPWLYRHDNGRREARGSHVPEGRHGRWTTWHGNGRRESVGPYVLGQKNGRWKTWSPSGRRVSQGSYADGERHGFWRTWHEDGSPRSRGRYREGEAVGRWIHWDRAGTRSVSRAPSPAPDVPPGSE